VNRLADLLSSRGGAEIFRLLFGLTDGELHVRKKEVVLLKGGNKEGNIAGEALLQERLWRLWCRHLRRTVKKTLRDYQSRHCQERDVLIRRRAEDKA
jgi:hypothetical protein